MNKKVLTLCAGVLLVGGSAVFTVNAVNAGNGKAQTAYVVKANAEGVAGYELAKAPANATEVAQWSLVNIKGAENGDYYLSPAPGYFLAADGSIKSTENTNPVKVVILDDLSLSFDGETAWKGADGNVLYLWTAEGTKQEGEGGNLGKEVKNLTLATAKSEYKDLAEQMVLAFDGSSLAYEAYSSVTTNIIKWTLTDDDVLTVTNNGTTATLMYKVENDTYTFAPLNNGSSSNSGFDERAIVVYEENQLQLVTSKGATQIKTPLYLTSSALTVDAKAADAQPAVLYSVDAEGKATLVEKAEKGKEYVIAQGIKEDVMGDTKYIANSIASTEQGAAGAEYGHINGIVFKADGTLGIEDRVTTAVVPVYIYYTVDKVNYYLTPDKTWSKDIKTVWTLVEGNLVSVAEEPEVITDIAYVKDGIIEGVDKGGHDIIIALSQTSLMANEIEACEYPLLNDITEDYVMLGGEITGGAGQQFFITQPEGQQAKFIQYVNESSVQNASETILWKVTKSPLNDGRYSYIFTNRATGEDLNINGYKRFIAYNYNGGVQLLGVDVNGNISSRNELAVVVTTSGVTTSNSAATVIGFYRSKLEQFTAHWLLHRYGSSFKLNVIEAYKSVADKTIWGNEPFENEDLVPVVNVGTPANPVLHEIVSENDSYGNARQFLLKKKGTNLYIVLNMEDDDRWSNAVESFVNGGYKFELLSEANLKTVLSTGEVNGKAYYPYFQINYLESDTKYDVNGINMDAVADNTPAHCIEVGYWNGSEYVFNYDMANLETTDGKGHLDVFVSVVENCGHNDARLPEVSFFTDNENIVRGEDATNNPLNYRYVNITFKAGANMQFQNERNNWVNLNGKVLGINQDGVVMPTEADYFLFDKAEGQWAVSVDTDDTRKFTFTNRENPSKSISVKSMHALGNDVYAVEYEQNDEWGAQYNWYTRPFGFNTAGTVRNQALRDTLIIKAAEGNLKLTKGAHAYNTDSYANWTKEDLQDKTFQLSIDAASQLYVTENEGKDSHFLGLTADETDVTNWRLVPFTAARVHDTDAVKYLTAGTDSVYTISHPMYWTGSEFKTYNDTTAIVAYALQNIQNNEWLRYDPSQNQTIESMICDPNSKNFTTKDLNAAYRFVLKEKAKGAQKIEAGAYNIVGVTPWGLNSDNYVTDNGWDKNGNAVTGTPHYELDYTNKLYGATSYQNLGAIEVENMYTQPTSNDIFTIATTASQEYVLATPRDTVRIYGNEENDFLLYEKGQFLNLGNVGDIAPAVVLDSAYVKRPGNNRYQYLLVVNPDYKEAKYDNHPDNNPTSQPVHMIKPDTMYGRFLVNKIDSAVLEARYHNNPYINDIEADEKELKLGFQWGYHTGDKLFLTEGEGKNSPVIETIDLGTPDFNKAKFAFKYVNEAESDAFKVQTAWYDYDSAVKAGLDNKEDWTWNNEGYLKSVNGVIVVTNGYTHGEEFLMAQDETNPTANETIAAEGAISVVATDGAVIIKGAEGKNVVIATILGKVVANETINSDNETIAVPAGIAVVSVDGESFKVVVK